MGTARPSARDTWDVVYTGLPALRASVKLLHLLASTPWKGWMVFIQNISHNIFLRLVDAD